MDAAIHSATNAVKCPVAIAAKKATAHNACPSARNAMVLSAMVAAAIATRAR